MLNNRPSSAYALYQILDANPSIFFPENLNYVVYNEDEKDPKNKVFCLENEPDKMELNGFYCYISDYFRKASNLINFGGFTYNRGKAYQSEINYPVDMFFNDLSYDSDCNPRDWIRDSESPARFDFSVFLYKKSIGSNRLRTKTFKKIESISKIDNFKLSEFLNIFEITEDYITQSFDIEAIKKEMSAVKVNFQETLNCSDSDSDEVIMKGFKDLLNGSNPLNIEIDPNDPTKVSFTRCASNNDAVAFIKSELEKLI